MNTATPYPFLSIIIPTYNNERMIQSCIESMLAQDYPKDKIEIIVVDNNSTDQTASIVKSFPVTYILEKDKQGPAATRNTGAKAARGEILVFFDGDQIATDGYLRHLISQWEDPSYGAFGAYYVFLPNEQDPIATKILNQSKQEFDKGALSKLGGGNAAYRKDVFEKLNGFNDQLFSSEDYDLAYRMQKLLNLKIKFNKDAIIYHESRMSKALFIREYRIGYGDHLLMQLHPELKKNYFFLFLGNMKRTLLGLLAILVTIVRWMPWKQKKEKILIIWLDIEMKWANYWGRFHSVLFKNLFPRDW